MDREKVINCLTDIENIMITRQEICPREELQYWIELQEGVADALELLKEQEAVEPLPQNSNGWVRTIKLWYCGACHSKISRRTSKYCPNCGKPILWKGQ